MVSGLNSAALDGVEPPALGGDRLRAQKMARQLSAVEFELFCAIGHRRDVSGGHTIFRKGELGQSMFVIESGEIHLEFGDGVPHKLLGEREFLGELALFVGDHTRVASAVAITHTVLRVIEHDAFLALLDKEPALMAKFMLRSFAYLVASEQQLIHNLKRRNEDLIATLDTLRQTETQLSAANGLIRTDELTGLTNRRGLYQFLDTLQHRRVPGLHLGLLLVDLDNFKNVNDEFGHLIGDRVLRDVARAISENAASCDLPCRLGGDEFALLVQLMRREDLEARAALIVSAVSALRFPPPHENLTVSVSVGASLCEPSGEWSTWYSEADSVLYHAKGKGGDCWRLAV